MGQGERRNKTKISGSRRKRAREGTGDVSATSKSTYKKVSKANESKMPGGSSVRPINPRSLKPTRSKIEKKK